MEQAHYYQSPPPPPQTTEAPATSVANATPNHPQLTSEHPSYAEMITTAILWDNTQGKAGGSSKRAIAKYIDRVYTNLPPTHSALLAHNLKRMKNTGQLVMIKNSYQLPIVAAATAAPSTPTIPATAASGAANVVPVSFVPTQTPQIDSTLKKRPGRPPKDKSATPISGATNGLPSGKRPRGRPPRELKPVVSEVPFVQAEVPGLNINGSPQFSAKRSPGRPKKVSEIQTPSKDPSQLQMAALVNGIVSSKKGPGRPPKVKLDNGVVQVSNSGGSKRRGRPKTNVLGPVSSTIGKKSRGRPPRQPGVGPAPGKRRVGRPPKGSVLPLAKVVMRKLYTGKPRGRPKKNASTTGKPMVDDELIKKVKNMQAKIRDAVGMLKPYFPSENATDEALIILQQLEDISMMDISVSPSPNPPAEEPPVEPIAKQPVEPPPVEPFSISSVSISEPLPFYMAPNIGTQQPNSGFPVL